MGHPFEEVKSSSKRHGLGVLSCGHLQHCVTRITTRAELYPVHFWAWISEAVLRCDRPRKLLQGSPKL